MRAARVLVVFAAGGLAAACGAVASRDGEAQTPPARAAKGIRLVSIGSFSEPLFVVSPPGDRRRLMVVQQGGRIVLMRGGKRVARPFLDISDRVTAGGEQGLLGLAFPPDYAKSRRFYVYYTDRNLDESVVEYRAATRDHASASTARVLLAMPDDQSNHNGGSMAFGPDGLLYIGTGDGGGADDQDNHGPIGHAQDLGSLLGKLLRIDPRATGGRPYRVPASNPFAGRSGARGEIYSYGLRNPWRFSFDRRTGALIIGDVGQDNVEEIDFRAKGAGSGANFGWRPWEGNRRNFDEPAPGAVFPVITHTHDSGFCSITGGYVVRDERVPALVGRYVYSDLCDGRVWAARLSTGGARGNGRLGVRTVGSVVSFGEDARGRVYVVSHDGPVYRFTAG
jgi:glucose/arabinose dehydrogenase